MGVSMGERHDAITLYLRLQTLSKFHDRFDLLNCSALEDFGNFNGRWHFHLSVNFRLSRGFQHRRTALELLKLVFPIPPASKAPDIPVL